MRRILVAGTVLGAVLGSLASAQADTMLKTTVDTTYQANGRVSAMVSVGNVTYLGGAFTAMRPAGTSPGDPSEVARSHLAAIDTTTGQVLPWDPGADGVVRALAASPDGATIYAGGDFLTVGGVAHQRLAAVSSSTGQVTGFTASAGLTVYGLAATASRVYVAGSFLTIDGQPRSRLAAIGTDGALDANWKPSADAVVRAIGLAPDGKAVYVGGNFSALNGLPTQQRLARLSPTTGAPLSWSSHPGYPVYSIAATPGHVFVGGDGSGGNVGSYSGTGALVWRLQTDGNVQAVASDGGTVYAGGHFDNVCLGGYSKQQRVGPQIYTCATGSAVRHKLIAVDSVTGTLDAWRPDPNSVNGVWSLQLSGQRLEAGGDFTLIGTNPRMAQQGFAQFSP